MVPTPPALPQGIRLSDRFEIVSVLGRGGFGIAYLALDCARGDEVVLKELAPLGVGRDEGGLMHLESLGDAVAHRLRRGFLEEARLLARLNVPGVLNVRASGSEFGTSYFVTEYVADAETLDQVLKRESVFSIDGALDVLYQLLETLDGIHARGILHRDIKPSNILLRPGGQAFLIDFGAAREWHADVTEHQTVLFTPGFAPLEQWSERARRGPATDLYGLAATVFTLLVGSPPPSATDRMNGVDLPDLTRIRPELDCRMAEGIVAALELRYDDRPPTVQALRELMTPSARQPALTTLAHYDSQLLALQKFHFGKQECPSCHQILHSPKPLKLGICPVCTKGKIVRRPINQNLCPICMQSTLHARDNSGPLVICPICNKGQLTGQRLGLLKKGKEFNCGECQATFSESAGQVTLTKIGEQHYDVGLGTVLDWAGWRERSHRATTISICDGCHAQLDHLDDGQWRRVVPPPASHQPSTLYPEEWARVAAGLEPGCGTHVCNLCEADYFVDGDRVTLLGAHDDPFDFADRNMGRLMDWEDLRWVGAGKESPKPGLTCLRCHTEFDSEGQHWRLWRTENRALKPHVDTLETLADWHRLARGLPRIHEEADFKSAFAAAVVTAYERGEFDFDDKGTLWRGPALRVNPDTSKGQLVVTADELSFGGLLRRDRIAMETVESVAENEGRVAFTVRGSSELLEFEVEDVEVTVHLKSGDRRATLGSHELVARLSLVVGKLTQV